jgi:hypothetical protein
MRALGLLVLLLVAASAEAQSIIYVPGRLPQEVDCSDFFAQSWYCSHKPVVSGVQRTLDLPTLSGQGMSAWTTNLKLNSRTTGNFYGNFTHIADYSASTGNYTQTWGLLAREEDWTTGTAEHYGYGAEITAGAYGPNTHTSYPVAGYFGIGIGSTAKIGYSAAGYFWTYANASTFSIAPGGYIAQVEVVGINVVPGDVNAYYKIKSHGRGRNYFGQTDDIGLYAAEVVGDKGLFVSGKNGQLQLAKGSGGAKPACASGTRGSFWYEPSGAGVKDTVEVCAKDAGDAYAWRTIY